MRRTLVALLGTLLAAAGTSTAAHARWQDTASVTGPRITVVTPQAPVVTCSPVPIQLLWLTFRWAPVLGATHYVVRWGSLGQSATVDASVTSHTITVAGAGNLTVEAVFGSGSWSATSAPVPYFLLLLGTKASCTSS